MSRWWDGDTITPLYGVTDVKSRLEQTVNKMGSSTPYHHPRLLLALVQGGSEVDQLKYRGGGHRHRYSLLGSQ